MTCLISAILENISFYSFVKSILLLFMPEGGYVIIRTEDAFCGGRSTYV